ncbi:MAG TPA: LuxR family transcriptional regulator, partial [Mycobacterium sp.]
SLVVAENSTGPTRYRLLETMRQYAQEKLGESREADEVRTLHRDHYTALAAELDAPAGSEHESRLEQVVAEIDNLRAAFAWSSENSDAELAAALASALQPLWLARGRIREGMAWFKTAVPDDDVPRAELTAATRARALADEARLGIRVAAAGSSEKAERG